MPTTKEAVEEFAKVAPSAAKFVGKYGAEIITDKEQRLGDSKVPAKKIPGNNGFSVSFAEDRDGVEMTVKKSQGANGIAVTYTRDQLRQLSDAINTYLAK